MSSGVYVWSQTAASNSNSDSTINWAEGQAPSSVNDSARAMMAGLSKYRDDVAGSLTTGGTSTAYTLTTNEVFDTLAHLNGQTLVIKFNATNGASPTLNIDGLGAGAIQVATGTAVGTGVILANSIWQVTCNSATPTFLLQGVPAQVQDGTVATASLAAGAVTGAKIASATIAAANMAANSVTAASVASSFFPLGTPMLNGTIVQSQSANAQTFAVKTLAGADPSASDPVTFLFRDATVATGDYLVRSLTGALSIVIPSGQAMGFTNATPGRVWIGAIDNAGTVELFVINCLTTTSTYPLQGWGIISTSAVSGAASSGVAYSTTSRSSKAYVPIGYATWEAGGTLGTAGTWNSLATRMQLFQSGSTPLPGQEIQRQRNSTGAMATGTTTVSAWATDNVPTNAMGDQYMSQAITPTSSANLVEIETQALIQAGGASVRQGLILCQDATVNSLASEYTTCVANSLQEHRIMHMMQAATLSATTFKIRAGGDGAGTETFNGAGGVRVLGGVCNSYIQVKEIMA